MYNSLYYYIGLQSEIHTAQLIPNNLLPLEGYLSDVSSDDEVPSRCLPETIFKYIVPENSQLLSPAVKLATSTGLQPSVGCNDNLANMSIAGPSGVTTSLLDEATAEGEATMLEDMSTSDYESPPPEDSPPDNANTWDSYYSAMQREALQRNFSTSANTSAEQVRHSLTYGSTSVGNATAASSIVSDGLSETSAGGTVAETNRPKYLNKAVYSLALAPKLLKKPTNHLKPTLLRKKVLSPKRIKPAIAPKSCTMYICIDSAESSAADSNGEDTEVVVLQTSEESTVTIVADSDESTENQSGGDRVKYEGEIESWEYRSMQHFTA